MSVPTIPAKRMFNTIRASTGLIKGAAFDAPAPGRAPAYSASGQDIWVAESAAPATRAGIVLSAVGAQCGKTFLAEHDRWGIVANTAAFGIAPGWASKFVQYVVNDPQFWLKGGAAQPYVLVPQSLSKSVWAATPEQQAAVLQFLDRETAEIDSFIVDQEQFVALLEERRRGEIRNLITGSDGKRSSTRLADWLGDVPATWRVSRLSRFFTVVLGKMLDAKQMTGEFAAPYIRAANISERGLRLDGLNQMDFDKDERQRLRLRAGDLLVVEGGAVGVNVMLKSDLDGVFFQKTVNRVRARDGASTRFLGYQLDLARWSGTIDMLSNKSTIAHLTAEKLERLTVALPSNEEQHAIVARLEAETASIDATIADAREAIALSKERRAALISAAVTGRIDVTERKRVLV